MVDKKIGLEMLGGDEELFAEIIADYVDESQELMDKINNEYASEDWKNYAIHVHGLKSASRTIGAMKLGEASYELEMASKALDIDKVKSLHPGLVSMHKDTIDFIKNME